MTPLGMALQCTVAHLALPNSVLVDTIHRYKGLEAAIVVLWGIDELDPMTNRGSLYVALSRAKSRLHLVGSELACKRILDMGLLEPAM